jgi:hypothetical protein
MEKCRPIAVNRPPHRPPREEKGKEADIETPLCSFPSPSPLVSSDLRESKFSPLLVPRLPPVDSTRSRFPKASVNGTASSGHHDPLNPATVALVPFALSCRSRLVGPSKIARGFGDMAHPGGSAVKSEGSGSSTPLSDLGGGSGAGLSAANESVKSRRNRIRYNCQTCREKK